MTNKEVVTKLKTIKKKLKLLDDAIKIIDNISEECIGLSKLIDISSEVGKNSKKLAEELIEYFEKND
jgi:hypothetical protein